MSTTILRDCSKNIPHFVADSSVSPTGLKWAAPASGSTFAGCSLKRSTMLTVATATVTDIGWDGEIFDTDGYHDNSTNNTRITIPSGKGGYYLFVHNQQSVNTVAATFISYRFFKNGVETYQVTNQTGTDTSGRVYGYQVYIAAAAVGDYFEVKVSQNSGGNVNYWFDNIATGLSNFSCSYLGA